MSSNRKLNGKQKTAAKQNIHFACISLEEEIKVMVEKLPTPAVYRYNNTVFINKATEKLIGYAQKDITTLQQWFKKLFGKDANYARKIYENDRAHGFQQPRALPIFRKDNAIRFVELACSNYKEAEIWLLYDITEAKKKEEERDRFFDISVDMVCVTGTDGYFKHVNTAWEKVLGWSKEELMSKPFVEFIHPDDVSKTMDVFEDILKNHTVILSFENRYVCKDGSYKWLQWAARIYPEEELLYATARDITEQKEIDNAKSEFVSLASHQLRTPLTNIKWTLEMFTKGQAGALNFTQGELIHKAYISAIHMTETISTMLMVSRIESKRIQLSNKVMKLKELLDDVELEQRQNYKQKGQKLTIKCPPKLSIKTDRKIMKEVIANLVSNAIKYTPSRGLIQIEVQKTGKTIHIDVQDSGLGIPKKQQAKIFSKFFRADNVLEESTEGTGLGLYLVHSLVQLLSGTISFTSKQNKGTTFSISLPSTPSRHGK